MYDLLQVIENEACTTQRRGVYSYLTLKKAVK